MSLDIQINESLSKKLSPDSYFQVITNTVSDTTLEAERQCKIEAPVGATGNLMRGHTSQINGLEGKVTNPVPYWPYVVYGHHGHYGDRETEGNIYIDVYGNPRTSKGIANNYPVRAINNILDENFINERLTHHLKNILGD